jgi:RNA polymerase sigma factor (sigma-70 family)
LPGHDKLTRFEQLVLPHWQAAYNLARWLTGQDADDVVQEAYLRAFKFFDGFHGEDSRAWLLTIVRRTAYTWLRRNREHELTISLDEELHSLDAELSASDTMLPQIADQELLRQALEALPVIFREVVILHDVEELSYKEIAVIADIPLGTVMSRLARARQRLQQYLTEHLTEHHKEVQRELR